MGMGVTFFYIILSILIIDMYMYLLKNYYSQGKRNPERKTKFRDLIARAMKDSGYRRVFIFIATFKRRNFPPKWEHIL